MGEPNQTTTTVGTGQPPSNGWYDASWLYRKPLVVTENSASTLTDYEVNLTINNVPGKMNSDFSDLRFTDTDGLTLLPYWIESYTASSTASVWVKLSVIPASGTKTIYMYYGNPSVVSASNGSTTFSFFDDFSGGINSGVNSLVKVF